MQIVLAPNFKPTCTNLQIEVERISLLHHLKQPLPTGSLVTECSSYVDLNAAYGVPLIEAEIYEQRFRYWLHSINKWQHFADKYARMGVESAYLKYLQGVPIIKGNSYLDDHLQSLWDVWLNQLITELKLNVDRTTDK